MKNLEKETTYNVEIHVTHFKTQYRRSGDLLLKL